MNCWKRGEGFMRCWIWDSENAVCASAAPAKARELLLHHEMIRVATKYPVIAKDYFYNQKYQTVDIIKLNGSVELGPIVGLSDVIVDIVETGSTLRGKRSGSAGGNLPSVRQDDRQPGEHADGNGTDQGNYFAAASEAVVRKGGKITYVILSRGHSKRRSDMEVKMRIIRLTKESRKNLLGDLLQRSPNYYGQYEKTVADIVEQVRNRGDEALFSYTKQFDGCDLTPETVSRDEGGDRTGLCAGGPRFFESDGRKRRKYPAFPRKAAQKQLVRCEA